MISCRGKRGDSCRRKRPPGRKAPRPAAGRRRSEASNPTQKAPWAASQARRADTGGPPPSTRSVGMRREQADHDDSACAAAPWPTGHPEHVRPARNPLDRSCSSVTSMDWFTFPCRGRSGQGRLDAARLPQDLLALALAHHDLLELLRRARRKTAARASASGFARSDR